MSCFYAKIFFAETVENIELKFNFMKNPKIFLWYVKKFNPYIVEDIYIGGKLGYKIILPLTKELAMENPVIANNLLLRVMEELEFNHVNIISYPKELQLEQNLDVEISNGKDIMLLYIMDIINKSLKALNRPLQKAEILLIADSSNKSNIAIEEIYNEVNYFSIIDEDVDNKNYEDTIERVFSETGLNINVIKKNNGLIKNADIIINMKKNNSEIESKIKSGAILIDFGLRSGKKKRTDVLYIDGITIKYNEEFIKDEDMDLILYSNELDYRKFKAYEYDEKYYYNIKKVLKNENIKLSSLMCEKNILNSVNYLALSRQR